ncbi:hypothetical protein IPH25_02805 [bacterium]|nr:MAG: hypothetical protein IPG37_04945 [bacterium]QQR61396.1 MAG: hypothetical protein IPH25_02805 [bacterium]QQR63083.1 MAG: hypothetical protein IPH67_01235 [bacterium]
MKNLKGLFYLTAMLFFTLNTFESMCGLDDGSNQRITPMIEQMKADITEINNNTSPIVLPLLGLSAANAIVYWQADGYPYIRASVGLLGSLTLVAAGMAAHQRFIIKNHPQMPDNFDKFESIDKTEQGKVLEEATLFLQKNNITIPITLQSLQAMAPVELAKQLPTLLEETTAMEPGDTKDTLEYCLTKYKQGLFASYVTERKREVYWAKTAHDNWNNTCHVIPSCLGLIAVTLLCCQLGASLAKIQ